MKASIITLATITGLVSAQFSGVPECAQGCLTTAISSAGCPISDVGCQCSSTAEIQGFGAGCILSACTSPGELQSAISGGLAICSKYFATVSASATGSPSSPAEATATTTETSETTEATETSTVIAETTNIPAPTTGHSNVTGPAPSGTGSLTVSFSPTPSQIPVGDASALSVGTGGLIGLGVALFAVVL